MEGVPAVVPAGNPIVLNPAAAVAGDPAAGNPVAVVPGVAAPALAPGPDPRFPEATFRQRHAQFLGICIS